MGELPNEIVEEDGGVQPQFRGMASQSAGPFEGREETRFSSFAEV